MSRSLRDAFNRLRGVRSRPRPQASVTLTAIAWVENRVDKPRPRGWERLESHIVVDEHHLRKLDGLGRFSHITIVFYMDLAADAPSHPDDLTLASGNTYGIFATRSQLRPNHLGVSHLPLKRIERNVIVVEGLDAIDGTAVLDIKPYLPEYDAFPSASIPEG